MRRVLLIAVVACSQKQAPPDQPPPPSPPRPTPVVIDAAIAPEPPTSPTAKPTAPKPTALSICKDPKAPLAAWCQIGQPAASAKLECPKGQPLSFHPSAIVWSCRYFGDRPPVTLEIAFPYDGPPIQSGPITVDGNPQFAPKGSVLVVEVEHHDLALEPARALADDAVKQATGWGCVELPREKYETDPLAHKLDCGGWTIDVHYNNITHTVYLAAGDVARVRS